MDTRQPESIEVSVEEAVAGVDAQNPLIDIRPESDRIAGYPMGSLSSAAEDVLHAARAIAAGDDRPRYVMCTAGVSSLRLVRELRSAGYHQFFSVAGGFRAWQQAGLPAEYPSGLDAAQSTRYARHLVMPQVGPAGQRKLLDSHVLLVGLGGLSSPAALYLAAAGVGTLGLVDDDTVEVSNLQRQILHGQDVVGISKPDSAEKRISALNPEVRVRTITERLEEANADALVDGWDLIFDGTDNFEARYALNAACVRAGKPLVYGSVMRFQGQVSVFWPGADEVYPTKGGYPCFRCLLPEPPAAGDTPSCSEAGVLGVLPGLVGTLQATESLKILLGIGNPLLGRLLMIDALSMDFRVTRVSSRDDCPVCS